MFSFVKISNHKRVPNSGFNTAYIWANNWDDFGFKCQFRLTVFNGDGEKFEIGDLKIGKIGLEGGWVEEFIPENFEFLGEEFFSLGQDKEYYQEIFDKFSKEGACELLSALRDVAFEREIYKKVEFEGSLKTSLMRTVSSTAINQQYRRIINGELVLTKYDFKYTKDRSEYYSGIDIDFSVKPESIPPTNIHAIIGRNGCGKTTLLHDMAEAALVSSHVSHNMLGGGEAREGRFQSSVWQSETFANVVLVSFSAFDPFKPIPDQPNKEVGTTFFYVGLKKNAKDGFVLKGHDDLKVEFVNSLDACLSQTSKSKRWLRSIEKLESDVNFSEMNLGSVLEVDESGGQSLHAGKLFSKMSSGHAIVLLSITKMVELLEEKTLVLIDEPESHLHPPLLAAFVRSLSDILGEQNAVAIIATHSPVVLQEVPASCVWKLFRSRLEGKSERPNIETFGENVGILTKEVFGLEIVGSGFYKILSDSLGENKSYEEVVEDFNGQIGLEGRSILRGLEKNKGG